MAHLVSCNTSQFCEDALGDSAFGCIVNISIVPAERNCQDLDFARSWANFFLVMIGLACFLLGFHLLLNFIITFKNSVKARQRRLGKQGKARKDKYEGLDNESAILAAELDELDDDDVDGGYSYEEEDENGKVVTKTKRWSQAIRESESAHKKFREEVNGYLKRNQELINQVRVDGAIIKVDSAVISKKKQQVLTMYRIVCLVFLKKGSLLQIPEKRIEEMVEELDTGIDMLEKANRVDLRKAEKLLTKVQDYCYDVAAEIKDRSKFHKFMFDITWDLHDPNFQKFQARVHKDIYPEDAFETVQSLMLAHGIASQNGDLVESAGGPKAPFEVRLARKVKRALLAPFPGWFLQFPIFYAVFCGGLVVVFMSYATKSGNAEDNLDVQTSGILGGTFLPLPPYYAVEERNNHKRLVPLIYAFMHCALYFLCWVPLPMTRGLLRDLSLQFPGIRTAIPIDNAYFFHKLMGMGLLACIAIGAAIFLVTLYGECQDEDALEHNSCTGFDQMVPAVFIDNSFEFNPIQNVVSLRRIVVLTWFPVFPMLHWANTIPRWAPGIVKKYWYEIWFYLHHLVAHISVVLALISRWEVFYPTLATWALYYLDKTKENYFNTAKTEIVIRPVFVSMEENPDDASSSTIHLDDKNKPNSVRLLIEVPPGFHVNAGQWIYLKVPEISEFQWHPFSLASASRDNFVELHIGIRCNKDDWTETNDLDDPWKLVKNKTWTYLLYKAIRTRIIRMARVEDPARQAEGIVPLYCKIRGPYGSTFTKCFDSHYYASVIIGAGTGLTAAESVLRELFWRKRQKKRVPKYAWFIWSCSRVDDLLWAWQSLHRLVFEAVKDKTIVLGSKWTEESLMADWLGIYFYVSRADKKRLTAFRERYFVDEDEEPADLEASVKAIRAGGVKSDQDKEMRIHDLVSDSHKDEMLARSLHNWMGNKKRLFMGSMDDPEIHVEKLFAWARLFIDVKAGRHKRMASCFCGPPALAHVLDRASRKVSNGKGSMQFSADHQ